MVLNSLCVVLLIQCLLVGSEPGLTIDEALSTGVKKHQLGDYDGAAALYSAVLQADPRSVDGLHLLGLARYAQVPNILGQAHGPNSAEYSKKAQVAANEATALVRRAWELQPARADIGTNLGEVLRSTGALDEAASVLKTVILLHPSHASAYFNFAMVESARPEGDPEAALNSFLALCARNSAGVAPSPASLEERARGMLGELLRNQGKVLPNKTFFLKLKI